jgi:hypothetical protein
VWRHPAQVPLLCGINYRVQPQFMMNFPAPASAPPDRTACTDPLRLAVAAYLARFKGSSRKHTESDLHCFLTWCAEHGLDPLAARRPHLELYIRWMQEIRRFKPSTVSRRFSVVAGFYRTCVIDGLLEHSPAEHVRRPSVPPESPTLGFTHLQFEALLTAARESAAGLDTWWWRMRRRPAVADRSPKVKPQISPTRGRPQPSPLQGMAAILSVGGIARTPPSSREAMRKALNGSVGPAEADSGVPNALPGDDDAEPHPGTGP